MRGGPERTLLLFSVAVLAIGSARAGAPETARNLILISIDTLRADRLGCYGHDRPTSPSLDGLAAEGTVFLDATATSPWTKPTHASMLTGLYPTRHGATTMDDPIVDGAVHLAEHLAKRGFRTSAVVNTSWLERDGLERGFQDFDLLPYVQGRVEGHPVTDHAVAWLRRREPGRRFFLFVHYMDVHSDYTAPPEHRAPFVGDYAGPIDGTTEQLYRIALGMLRVGKADVAHLLDLYDAGIHQVDAQLGRLFAYLRNKGLLETSLVVITSDHGEEFLEHGSVIHGKTQHREVVRVPLVLRGPGVPQGERVAVPASSIDLMPTALALLDVPVPPGLDGLDLRPAWGRGTPALDDRLLFSEADVTFPPPDDPRHTPIGPHRAVRGGRFVLHRHLGTGAERLFDLAADPGEQRDLRARKPQVAELLARKLDAFLGSGPARGAAARLTPEERRILGGP